MWHRSYVKRMPALRSLEPRHLEAAIRRAKRGTASRRLGAPVVANLVLFCLLILLLWAFVFRLTVVAVPWLRSVDAPKPVQWLVFAAMASVVPLGCLFGGWAWSRMGSGMALRELARRVRERECVVCGYNLLGLDAREPCPECNAANLAAPEEG
ncbi:MAG: hypothetical protein JJU33_06125 [Phycisphaerales bacterium]|nr:hypothetical protein [Phycisphaerales bacterium]